MPARRADPARAPAGAGSRDCLHAEWTKLRTAGGTGWLLLAVIALTLGLGAMADAAARCPSAGCQLDPAKTSFLGVYLGQAVVAGLAVVSIGGEYSSGMILVTFTAMPRRASVLAAKAVTVTGPVLAAGMVAILGSLLVGGLMLPGHGFTPGHGSPPLSLGDPPVLRAAAGSVLYLALIALLSLGVTAAVRDTGAAIGVVLGLLYVFPVITTVVKSASWHRRLEQFAPMTAGLDIQATTGVRGLALSPWAGLGVLAAWSAGALLLGGLLLRLRDA